MFINYILRVLHTLGLGGVVSPSLGGISRGERLGEGSLW